MSEQKDSLKDNLKNLRNDLFALGTSVSEMIEKKTYDSDCVPILTFDSIVQKIRTIMSDYPSASIALISVKENEKPQNENDNLIVLLAILDAQKRPITLDGMTGISYEYHAKTIDKKMIDLLKGNSSVMIKLKNGGM